jgi:hypothetical protein
MQASFLTPAELATRWRIPPQILGQWRWEGRGPAFHKIGRISYRLEDVEQFEDERRRNASQATSNRPSKRPIPSWERLPDVSCLSPQEI